MWITHSYLGTTRQGVRCLFFLLFEDYIDAQSGLSDELKLEIERFARNMGNYGAVVAPFAGDAEETQTSVRDKHWSPRERELIMNTPAMLMIDEDFSAFDPRRHQWVLFHFGRHSDQDPGQFRSLLHEVSDAVASDDGNPFSLVRQALRNQQILAASEAIELRPGVFGISVDLRVAWEALKDYLRSHRASHETSA